MNLQEIRETPVNELKERVKELKRELFDLRVQSAVEAPDSTGRVAAIRTEIARALTVIREQELAEAGKRSRRDRILYRKKRRSRQVKSRLAKSRK